MAPLRTDLLFPIETINRELDFRLALACAVADGTNRVFLGQHDVIYGLTQRLRGGVYVGCKVFRQRFSTEHNGIPPHPENPLRYAAMKERGFTLVYLQEEGGVFPGDAEEWRRFLVEQFDITLLREDDFLCNWGDFQTEYYKKIAPPQTGTIVTTGHPRFDLHKQPWVRMFDDDVAALRRRFGDFALVNTSLVAPNNGLGHGDTFSPRLGYQPSQPANRSSYIEMWAALHRALGDVINLVSRLSVELPNTNIVLRPHPGEDMEFYRTIFGGVPNVHVLHEGSVNPWLYACRVMIHVGCTTAIEAALAGKPVINYKLVPSRLTSALAESFGWDTTTASEIVDAVRGLTIGRPLTPTPRLQDRADDLLANLNSDAFPRIAGVITQAQASAPAAGRFEDLEELRRAEIQRVAMDRAKAVVRPLLPARHARYRAYRSHFPGFDRQQIHRKVAALVPSLGRRVSLRFLSDALLVLEAS